MDWIPFEEGEYIVESALLLGTDGSALPLEQTSLVIFRDRQDTKRMRGFGITNPALMVDLLEDDDRIDLLLDLGGKHKYRLENPRIQAGKVFSPQARSTVQFSPRQPWQPVAPESYRQLVEDLQLIHP